MKVRILSVEFDDGDMRRYGVMPLTASIVDEWDPDIPIPVVPIWIEKDEKGKQTIFADLEALTMNTYLNLTKTKSFALFSSITTIEAKARPQS